jgi:hypothetical protein
MGMWGGLLHYSVNQLVPSVMSSDNIVLGSLACHNEDCWTGYFPGQWSLANENEGWAVPLLCKSASPLCHEQQ